MLDNTKPIVDISKVPVYVLDLYTVEDALERLTRLPDGVYFYIGSYCTARELRLVYDEVCMIIARTFNFLDCPPSGILNIRLALSEKGENIKPYTTTELHYFNCITLGRQTNHLCLQHERDEGGFMWGGQKRDWSMFRSFVRLIEAEREVVENTPLEVRREPLGWPQGNLCPWQLNVGRLC